MPFDLGNWESQVRKGLLELVLLTLLQGGERYGYELVRATRDALGAAIIEGTVYPILTRLARDGLITHRWSTDDTAQPRKYYRLTADGLAMLKEMSDRWLKQDESIRRLLMESPR
tara:strand:+ start:2013 stop:2357 length:345 start_codon:yes stop_codon:yes gene_type:complete